MAGVQGSERANMEALGLRVDAISALHDQLEADFSVSARGFALFGDTLNERARAVRADETVRATTAVSHNLMEARLHERDLSAVIGEGLQAARTGSGPEAYLALKEVDRQLAGLFRAFGSVLDTLAATALGVLRVPRSILRADYVDLFDLDQGAPDGTLHDQRSAWEAFRALIAEHRRRAPEGWLDYAVAHRNSVVHRARQLAMNFPAPRPRLDLVVVTNDPMGVELARTRFRPHLRRRPWMPDLDDLIESTQLSEVWLSEPATVTVSGLRSSLNDLVEDAADQLLRAWAAAGRGELVLADLPERRAPTRLRWALPQPFVGYASMEMPDPMAALGGGLEAKRSALARDLRNAARENEGGEPMAADDVG